MQNRMKNLLKYCYNDTDSIEFQLFLISVKCLLPYENNIGCLFDKDRYKKEIELFSYYMNGNDETINYWLQNKRPSNMNDKLSEFKIIPIVLANTVWENSIEEVLKAVTFYTLNKNTILNALTISSAIYEFMNRSEIENIEAVTKEKLIDFSVKDYFTKNLIETNKNYIIKFERERIKLIAKPTLFDDDIINCSSALNYIFEKKDASDNKLNTYLENTKAASAENISDAISSFSIYLHKLRKGSISPEKLIIPDKIPDIKECLKYSVFTHPLLGRCKVVKRTENTAIVKNKSGLMRIKI
ncbi:MAG: hypothetical protein GX289_11615 [Tissierellia bacterium]|nr:hypothetical protein [Tissierellia bacterium]